MAQHDYNLANQSGADFRADLNNALSAIVTVNSGATEPSTTFAHQLWVDTSSNVLKIRNATNNAWITTGVSITASNTFTGNITGNADTATTLATARTINGVSFDGSANISFDTDSVSEGSSNLYFTNERVDDQVNTLLQAGTGIQLTYDDTAGTLTIANTNDADITGVVAGNGLTGGGTAGTVTLNVAVDDSSIEIDSDALRVKALGITNAMLAGSIANAKLSNSSVTINSNVLSLGNTLTLDTDDIGEGSSNLYYTDARARASISEDSTQLSYNSTTGVLSFTQGNTDTVSEGSSNLYYTQARFDSSFSAKTTADLTENTNLYYTTARANTDFDTRLATKDTGDLTEGSNLYYTTARVNSDFDTRLATKSTTDLAEGTNLYYTSARFDSAFTSKDTDSLSEGSTNLYYTTARFDSAFGNKTTSDLTEGTNLYYTDTRANSAIDTRVTKAFVDALGIQASSVDANSVTLGTDTVGNYVQTITGTANKITVSGSGSELADVTLTLPDNVQIADSLTVAGNLTVNGTLTSLDTTNLDIEDNLFQLNAGLTGNPVNDSGMLINRGTADNSIFMWDESVDKFTLGLTTADGSATGNITLNSLGTLVANIEGDVTGSVTGTVSSLSNHDTGDLAEGSNLYYTQARFDSAFTAKSTSDLSEGSNLYYTDARFDTRLATKDTDDVSEGTSNLYYTTARFDSAFGGKSTSDLSEGTNLYYTSARANANFDTRLATKDTGDLAEGSNLYYTDARADARVNLQTGANLDLSSKSTSDLSEGTNLYYTTSRSNTDFDTRLATKDTGDLSEGTNLYYTDARANSAIDARVTKTFVDNLGIAASTADTLSTARTINGVSFDGSANITTLTSGTGVTVSGTEVSIGQAVSSSDSPTFSNLTLNGTDSIKVPVGTTAQRNGTPTAGMFRYNSTTGEFEGYTTEWGAIAGGGNGSYTTDIFTATSGQTAFTLSASVSNENNLIVFVDGVFQAQNTYSVSGTTLTFATGIVLDRVVTVYHVEPVSIGTPSDGTVTSAKLSGALTTPSDLTVTGDLNATLATAAQPNITSVGTLTGLEIATSASDTGVDLTINGNKSSNGAVGSIIFENASDSVAMIRASRVGGNNDAADMQFFTQATGGSNTERMRISSAGLVGIGTNSPSSRLDIVHNNNNPLRLQNSTGVIVKTQFEDNASRQAEIALNTGSITFSNGTSSVTERMRIDSSGKAIFKGVTENELYAQFLSAGASSTVSGYVGRASSVVSGGTATDLGVGGGAGNLVFAAGGSTEKMRIDSSGNVGIGLTNPSDYYSTSLVVNANNNGITLVSPTNAASYIMFADGTSSQEEQYRGYIEYSHSIDTLISRSAGAIRFLTGGSNERMRIDSAGNVLINQTSSNLTYGKLQVSAGGETAGHGGIVGFFDTDGSVASSNLIQLLSFSGDTDATGGQFIRFRDSNSVMGSVSAASGTTVAYNTSSDRRMKENIVDASSQLDVINNIQVREFDWKNNGHHEVGMIAQELNDVIPNVVQEGGDDVTEQPWGVDYGKLTPYLIKAIQELSDKVDNQQTIIDNLTTRIETLEG